MVPQAAAHETCYTQVARISAPIERSPAMRTLARPIGLGLAARGDVDEVVSWARQARDQGLDSVWVHDSYFERDGVSFTTAIAQAIAPMATPTRPASGSPSARPTRSPATRSCWR